MPLLRHSPSSDAAAASPQEDGHGAPLFRRSDEFAPGASEWPADLSRRDFLQLMGASLALAGLGGCNRPPSKEIVPYTVPPEAGLDVDALYYATAMDREGFGRGLLVEAHSGRPTKIEGNPNHPDSLGATDVFMQAAVLSLYDPERSRTPTLNGNPVSWAAYQQAWLERWQTLNRQQGAGLAVLTEPTTSPSLLRALHTLLDRFPQARWFQHTPLHRWDRHGRQLGYDLERADVIFSLGSDFLYHHPAALRHTRAFARRRRVSDGRIQPNRLYVAESTPSVTGSMADHRLALPPSDWGVLLNAVGSALRGDSVPESAPPAVQEYARRLARDLDAHRGAAVVLVGEELPAPFHDWAAAVNAQLGAVGSLVRALPAVRSDADPRCAGDLAALTSELARGSVQTLVVLECNPAHTAPVDIDFAGQVRNADFTLHAGQHQDETAALCRWHVPTSHFLESWSDLRAFDGTPSIVQPLIQPLYDTVSPLELLHQLSDPAARSGYELVRDTWRPQVPAEQFEGHWRHWLDTGVVDAPAPGGTVSASPAPSSPPALPRLPREPGHILTALIRPDHHLLDGRWATNNWLQELPRPFTNLVWDNALLVPPVFAREHGLADGDEVTLSAAENTIACAVWILRGQAADTLTLHLGYGRRRPGVLASEHGYDAYRLRRSDGLWQVPVTDFRKTGRRRHLVSTQGHFEMEGRDLVRTLTAEELPHYGREKEERASLLPEYHYTGHAWAMVIDLSTCTGCNACVIACQAENNIPVVGKEQVARGREMFWIRIDRYFHGDPENPALLHQPVPCMHCEKAPCELVCPVGATVHSSEGLNEMVYNRCIGTRYCSNNCPYKVRRFNFLDFRQPRDSTVYLQANPNVTVRQRGVMEKCTYCVQRIEVARIRAGREKRPIRDGEIRTACQQACPAEAIVFGDLSDRGSRVVARRAEPVNYGLLTELNTQPRTTYLARVFNREESEAGERSVS